MERESAARRVQPGGKGEIVIPYPKEEICGEEQGATNEECSPAAHPVGWARGALGAHSTYPRGLYRISNRGQRLYQTRVGSGSCSGGSVNEIRRMPQQFAYLGLYQLGYTIATFGWSSSTRWPTSYVAAALTLPSPWTDRERDRKRTPRRNQREGIKKFA